MFYVVRKGWVAAGDLTAGDKLCLESGKTVTVTGSELEKLDKPIKVYNLEVLDNHTYFVGDKAVLVHNIYKSDHAKQRQNEGRNVGTAGNDLQNARPADVYIQTDDGRYVLKGKNGRVHIFETDGELVTTMNKVTNFAKRVASGRYTSPSINKLKEFVKVFGEYLNKGWDEYR